MPREFCFVDQAGGDRNGAHPISLGRASVVGMIADKRPGAGTIDLPLATRVAQSDSHQVRAIMGHFSKRSEAQVAAESGSFHLGPANAREVARDESRRDAASP